MKKTFKEKILRYFLTTLGVVLLMCVSYAVSYRVTKNLAPSKTEGAKNYNNENYDEKKPFPNLPVTLSGIYEEGADFVPDTNDYLVIAEGNLVNLYIIDKDENKTFEKVLEIDINALKEEDKTLLKKGILLGDRASVLSLIEDYSS